MLDNLRDGRGHPTILSARPGGISFQVPSLACSLSFLASQTHATSFFTRSVTRKGAESENGAGKSFGFFWAFLFASAVISFESCPIDLAIMLPNNFHDSDRYPLSTKMTKFVLPVHRSLLLILMAGWGIASNYGPIRT